MSYHWSIHQLTEYLVTVSRPDVTNRAVTVALERAGEALEAELGAVVVDGTLLGSAGFGHHAVPTAFVEGCDGDIVDLPLLGPVHLAGARLDTPDGRSGTPGGRLVIGRIEEDYSAEERQLLQGMALMLGLRLQSLAALAAEQQRHRLVEHLLQIQRAISARQPLAQVLDAVTSGAAALLGDAPVVLLLTDQRDLGQLRPVSRQNMDVVDEEVVGIARRSVVPGDAEADTGAEEAVLAERVVVAGEVVGCLVARTRRHVVSGHTPAELLSAFAQQVNLALTDAKTLDAVREAHRDPVTALPNRTLFLQRLDEERERALNDHLPLTVLFIDLDRFKAVNDTLGHRAGDHLLAEVARRIITCVNDQDVVARLGGDEFAVLLRGADSRIGGTVAARIIAALTRTFVVEGRDVLIGASVGVAQLAGAQHSSASLLGDADVAMYCAKRSGRGRWVAFEARMHDEVADQLDLRSDLQHALRTGGLWVAYQPIVDVTSGRVDSVEALLRWNHPTRGVVPPSDFIPIAEESELICELGAFVIDTALADLRRWRRDYPDLTIAINVSARQVAGPQLLTALGAALSRNGLPAEAVTLEVTESLVMSDPAQAREDLQALRTYGIQIAVDDFGTGYSSLAYLRHFTVDQVKIDRGFVSGLRRGAGVDIALLRGILDLCRALGVQAVAEGVEEAETLEILAELGCDLAQGYYLARPRPAEDKPHRLPVAVRAAS
ncbi:MAG TPA: bifunctional diguanylate cyclase/phosphodiesterase [Kineosporiaceae bacterium]|nr:bifunctional diguanylate cyclase/phosphodiesterase [Kineosporiaceae bacterium]